MKTKHSVFLFVASIALGAVVVWLLAGGPTAEELIAPIQIQTLSEAGATTFEEIHQKLSSHKVIVIGIPPQPEKYEEIVSAFVSKMAAENQKIVVLKEPKWGALKLNIQTADFDFNSEDIESSVKPIRDAIQAGQQIIIYTVSIYSSHLIDQNAIHRFEKAFGQRVASLTIGQLTLRDAGEHLVEPACVGSMRDPQGLYPLGCGQLANSRKYYKKLLPLTQKTMMLVEESPDDYLLQIYFPANTH